MTWFKRTPRVVNYTINLTAPSPEVGRKLVEAIKAYERESGNGWRK